MSGITIVDHRGRTVCQFNKRVLAATDEIWIDGKRYPAEPAGTDPCWFVDSSKPPSRASDKRGQAALARDGADVMHHGGKSRLRSVEDSGRRVLELPGLTLRWEKVTPVLDRLTAQSAEHDTLTLTIDQLRECVQRSC